MTFTKRHYEIIVDILARNNANSMLVNDFISYFKEDNSMFDISRFVAKFNELKLKYCFNCCEDNGYD